MRRFPVSPALLLTSAQLLFAVDYREVPELAAIFQKEGLDGTFVLLDISKDNLFLSNKARAERRITPASTFKIANSLIGLDCGAVRDVDGAAPYAESLNASRPGNMTCVSATPSRSRMDADAEKRIPIGRECLKALGKL